MPPEPKVSVERLVPTMVGADSWDPTAFDSTEVNDRLAEIKL
jgi:hypothetical protein